MKAARELRTEQETLKGKDSPEALAAKLYANGVYGKVCQSLRPKNVFDTRTVSSVRLKPSPITNPAMGAYVTGFIRAILAAILNRIPRERTVLSVTTDGFLCDVPEAEMAACLTGPLCRRFQALCDEIVPDSKGSVQHLAHVLSPAPCALNDVNRTSEYRSGTENNDTTCRHRPLTFASISTPQRIQPRHESLRS